MVVGWEIEMMALPSKSSREKSIRADVERWPTVERLIYEWSASFYAARVIFDDQRNILWLNRAGTELLKGDHTLINMDGKLIPASPRNLAAFLSLIDQAKQRPQAMLLCEEAHESLVIQVHPIEGSNESRHPVCYGLFANDLGPLTSNRMVDFRTAFNLTRAENDIAMQLLNGKRLRTIASENTVSIQTVRTQVKRIFQKMNVAGKEEFYSLALRCII
jgi:DNA-binding CsgD family transcriptional regulator